MKLFLASLFLCCTFVVSAQTSVIGLKSHHGDIAQLPESTDNFGEMGPMPIIDSVVKINSTCVIQSGKDNGYGFSFRDTICEHWFYERVNYLEEKVQEYHGSNVVLIGFNQDGSNLQIENNSFFKKRTKQQSMPWIFIFLIVAGLAMYIAKPKRAWKK